MKVSPKLISFVLRLLAIIGVVYILFYGKALLTLLTVAGLIAILLNPVDNKLREWGWKPGFSIAACILLLLLFFTGIFFAIGQQASHLSQDWPKIKERLVRHVEQVQQQAPFLTGGGQSSSTEPADTTSTNTAGNGERQGPAPESSSSSSVFKNLPFNTQQLTGVLSGTLSLLADFFLMFVYIVLFLSQKGRLREFVLRRAPDDRRGETHETINKSTEVAQQYLKGRLILILILSVLYSVGFSIVGLDYAIVISVLVAVLSIIPWIGNIIGGGIAVAIAVANGGDSTMILGIVGTIALAQTLESYILTPLIVGDEVNINPLTTIVGVIAFTIMWGAIGAIVAIPILAILRIVFKHIKGMEDYAYLLGQE